jgi:hypothetical protein
MPFKGDLRLGGPHDNEASLNGTSSDFDGVPAAGTILSGPTDTSRYVADYLGNQYYMPYSTTVYADGLGGQNSVETWGLQYYPAGWVTSVTSTPINIEVYAVLSSGQVIGPYSLQVGTSATYYTEDGTGINYPAYYDSYSYSNGQHIDGVFDGYVGETAVYRWQIQYQNGSAVLAIDNLMHPAANQQVGGGQNDVTMTIGDCGNSYTWGYYSFTTYTDGTGGTYTSNGSTNETMSSGSYIGECNGQHYYYSGGGTSYTGYPPSGYTWSESSSSSLTWYYPDTGSYGGDWTYSSGGCTYTADGSGGYSNQSCGGWSANQGDQIASGSYSSFSWDGGYDEYGNQTGTYYTTDWIHRYNGSGGYYTDTSTY